MPYRFTYIRVVENNKKPSGDLSLQPFSLIRAALAAAEETMEGSLMSASWLRFFQTHLSEEELGFLRWRGDLAESTEMRRAFSAIYGRYFSRGLLASKYGFIDFTSLLRVDTPIEDGALVKRKRKQNGDIQNGDIPDWIAIDPVNKTHVLVEAKGSLSGNEDDFLNSQPSCVRTGKEQFERVETFKSNGDPMWTRNWVAANLWSTDARPKKPVSLLWDPEGYGEKLTEEEFPEHAAAIRKHRIAKIAIGLGRDGALQPGEKIPGLVVNIKIEPRDIELPKMYSAMDSPDRLLNIIKDTGYGPQRPIEEPSREVHEECYVASLITPLGIRPILTKTDLKEVRSTQKIARKENRAAMIYGLSGSMLKNGKSSQKVWISDNGIASSDGAGLFDLRDIRLGEM